jgi:transcriptional regulator GlxA family with amidase domain
VEIFLFELLSDQATSDRVLSSAIETIQQTNGKFSTDEISEKIRAHRRQIERKFSS